MKKKQQNSNLKNYPRIKGKNELKRGGAIGNWYNQGRNEKMETL